MELKQITAIIISIIVVILSFLIFHPTFIQGITIIILIGLGVYVGLFITILKNIPHHFKGVW